MHVLFSGLLRSDLSNREKYEINPQMHLFSTVTKATVETKKTLVGQKFQKVENDENRFFAITSSKLFKN